MLGEFKKFISRGNVLDLAVAFILGAAFTTVVKSAASDLLMPPISLIFGNVKFADRFIVLKDKAAAGPYATLQDAQGAGAVTWNYGLFVDNVIGFLLTAIVLFLIIRYVTRALEMRKQQEIAAAPTQKSCPFCQSKIAIAATRCAFCTSELPADA